MSWEKERGRENRKVCELEIYFAALIATKVQSGEREEKVAEKCVKCKRRGDEVVVWEETALGKQRKKRERKRKRKEKANENLFSYVIKREDKQQQHQENIL